MLSLAGAARLCLHSIIFSRFYNCFNGWLFIGGTTFRLIEDDKSVHVTQLMLKTSNMLVLYIRSDMDWLQ